MPPVTRRVPPLGCGKPGTAASHPMEGRTGRRERWQGRGESGRGREHPPGTWVKRGPGARCVAGHCGLLPPVPAHLTARRGFPAAAPGARQPQAQISPRKCWPCGGIISQRLCFPRKLKPWSAHWLPRQPPGFPDITLLRPSSKPSLAEGEPIVSAFKKNTVTTGFPFKFLHVAPTWRLCRHWPKLGPRLGPCPGPSATGVGPGGTPSAPDDGSSRDRAARDPAPPCPGPAGRWRRHGQCVQAAVAMALLGVRPRVNKAEIPGLASVC